MNVPEEFYNTFKAAYANKEWSAACQQVLGLFSSIYPDEMKNGLVDKDLVDMYLDVLAAQKIDLKNNTDIDLFVLEPARQKLFGIEDDDDDWNF